MSVTIFYRFHSGKKWKHFQQPGLITVSDLQNHLSKRSQIGSCHHNVKDRACTCQFILKLFNADTNEEFYHPYDPLEKNSKIIVKRLPRNRDFLKPIEKQMVLKSQIEREEQATKDKIDKAHKEASDKLVAEKAAIQARQKEIEDARYEAALKAKEEAIEKLGKESKNDMKQIKTVESDRMDENMKTNVDPNQKNISNLHQNGYYNGNYYAQLNGSIPLFNNIKTFADSYLCIKCNFINRVSINGDQCINCGSTSLERYRILNTLNSHNEVARDNFKRSYQHNSSKKKDHHSDRERLNRSEKIFSNRRRKSEARNTKTHKSQRKRSSHHVVLTKFNSHSPTVRNCGQRNGVHREHIHPKTKISSKRIDSNIKSHEKSEIQTVNHKSSSKHQKIHNNGNISCSPSPPSILLRYKCESQKINHNKHNDSSENISHKLDNDNISLSSKSNKYNHRNSKRKSHQKVDSNSRKKPKNNTNLLIDKSDSILNPKQRLRAHRKKEQSPIKTGQTSPKVKFVFSKRDFEIAAKSLKNQSNDGDFERYKPSIDSHDNDSEDNTNQPPKRYSSRRLLIRKTGR